MTTAQLLKRLDDLRTDRDWSYDHLAAEIHRATGIRRSGAAFRRAIVGQYDLRPATKKAVERFLAAVRKTSKVGGTDRGRRQEASAR